MTMINRELDAACSASRHGIAAVECSIVAPLLIILVLGAIDVGEFANVCQKVSDASREGARIAVQNETRTYSQVSAGVTNYLHDAFPQVPPAILSSAVSVVVSDATGSSIAGGDLTTIASGAQIRVTVNLQYDFVRWINHLPLLDGKAVVATSVMRRE